MKRVLRIVALCVLVPLCVQGQGMKPYIESEGLHLRSPGLRLLSSEARQRLRDGATVTYAFRISIGTERRGVRRSSVLYHCVFSYDLWEEKYKVGRREPGYRSASHLTQAAAEELCLDSLVVPVSLLPQDVPFWLLVEFQDEGPDVASPSSDSRSIPGALIDIFSRRNPAPPSFVSIESGPFRLQELRGNR